MNSLKNEIFNEIDIEKLSVSFEEAVKNAIESFWEFDNSKIKINAINNFRDFREEKAISKINFFSSQIKVQNHRPVLFRLSEEFVDSILTKVLKSNKTPFNLQVLTNLEIKILNNFCEFLYKKIDAVLVPTKEAKITEQSDKSINLVFFVSINEDECSKIMLSIPKDRFKFEQLKKTASFRDENFLTSTSIVKIKAGSSKITLDELKNLNTEDIILLENSNSTKLTLISGELVKEFSIKADPSLILNIKTDDDDEDDTEEEQRVLSNEEVTMEKNLWDDIQIEINAEFEKVKMTIGELKQITQGQIVDLGSVFDNEISLFVEDKIVAKGELVIINNKYAVKLNKVYSPVQQKPQPQNAQNTPPAQKPIPKPAQNTQNQPHPAKPAAATPRPAAATPRPAAATPRPIPKPAGAAAARPAPKPAAAAPRPIPKPAAAPQKPAPAPQKEDFDYSDFEK